MNTIVNHKITKKLAAAVIAMFCLAGASWAQTFDISLPSGCPGNEYNVTSSNYILTGNNPSCEIVVAANAIVDITLNGVAAKGLFLNYPSTTTLTLTNANSFSYGITGGGNRALTIKGTGSLTTGTGGGVGSIDASPITIISGTVNVGTRIWTYGESVTVTGGKLDVTGDINGNLTASSGEVIVGGNVNDNLTVSGGNVNITGNVSGTTNFTGGTVNGKDKDGNPVSGSGGFGPVPNTGLPDITLYTYLMFFFGGVSILLWGHVLYYKFFGKKG